MLESFTTLKKLHPSTFHKFNSNIRNRSFLAAESLQNNSDDMNNTVIDDFLGRRMSVEDPKVVQCY